MIAGSTIETSLATPVGIRDDIVFVLLYFIV